MKKILFVVISAILTLAIQAQEKVSDYFYPKYSQEYTWLPESDFPQELEIIVSSRGWERVIQEKLRMTDQNGYPMGSTITIYAYDISDDAVISTGQLYSNFLGESRRNDRITILKLPSKQNTWIEYNKGDKYECKSEWVYVSYKNNKGKSVIQKAVKMTKSTVVKLNKVKTITDFSYWTKYGEIASFGKWDNDTPTIKRIANFISTNEIKEVSKQEYEAYAEAERKAELERKYQQFVSNLKPQKLSKENPEAANLIHKLFLDLEESRYTQMILNDMLKLEEKTKLYVSIPPESEFYVEVPDGEKDTVASLISDLLVKGILKIATVTEPNTQRTCSLEQYLSESYSVQVETLTFDVVKTKDSWRLADKKAVMPRDYATYIKQAAQNVYDTNKKAKKQTVELRKLRIINNNGWDNARIKIWHVQKDIANPDKNKYVLL
ncbi:MAG: hypothetical protein J6A35_03610 [Paludibacteraceae bacterium]|nr:hypothetical protein [Paludibacteraceae bacterium]